MFFPTVAGARDVTAIVNAARARGVRLAEWTVGGQWWGLVAEPATPARTAFVLHGNAGWAGDRLYYLAPLLARGCRVVLFEYPGYGPRAGAATVENVLAATRRALEEAPRTWPEPLLPVGESLGAGLIAQLAKNYEPQLAGLVLITPWDSLRTVAKMHYPWLPVGLFLEHPMDSVAALKSFGKPIAVLVAGRDEIVGPEGGRTLARAVGARLVVLPDAGHNDWPALMSEARWDELLAL